MCPWKIRFYKQKITCFKFTICDLLKIRKQLNSVCDCVWRFPCFVTNQTPTTRQTYARMKPELGRLPYSL